MWTVIKHQVEAMYPELPELVQRALNIEQLESWDEQLRFTAEKAKAIMSWDHVLAIVAASSPPFLADLEYHINFFEEVGWGNQAATRHRDFGVHRGGYAARPDRARIVHR